ncbi:MAG: hypothetical protein HQM12_10515 [SAR324 cluster bacterium]|nr:hypothetical protein [SAR324 cluster bacterium]
MVRGKELASLFSAEQICFLYNKEKLSWIDVSITESGPMASFHTFLIGKKKYSYSPEWEIEPLWNDLLIDADILAQKLNNDFFCTQPISWLGKFIEYVSEKSASLKRTPFLRLISNNQVSLPENNEVPRPAWFAPHDSTDLDLSVFPIVHPELSLNKNIRTFLSKEGIREIDEVAIIEKSILPKYQGADTHFDEVSYRKDLARIKKAYNEVKDSIKEQLRNHLNTHEWMACVNASGVSPNKIIWKKPGDLNLFAKTSEHEIWFDGLNDTDAYFLHASVIEELKGFELNRLTQPVSVLTINFSTNELPVDLSSSRRGDNKRGLKGFNPRATILGLESAWTNWSMERSIVLWTILLSNPLRLISGETQSASNSKKLDTADKVIEYTKVGDFCYNQAWLPDKSGNWHKPNELFLSDLPEGFDSISIAAKELAEKIGMRQPEREQALDIVTGGDPDLKKYFEYLLSASEADRKKMMSTMPQEIPHEPAPSFRDGLKKLSRLQRGKTNHEKKEHPPLQNRENYQSKLNEQVEIGVEEHQSLPHIIKFSPVKNQPSNAEARRFLYEQYGGRCQVTGMTFSKASRNIEGDAENYFEACCLLSYSNADYLNNAGNMLCVSADTMAMFKYASFEFLESIDDIIEKFKREQQEQVESVSARIILASHECTIKWTERHFMRLVALYDIA